MFQAAIDLKLIIISYQNIRRQNNKNYLKKGCEFISDIEFVLIQNYAEIFNEIKIIMLDLEKDSNETIFWALSNILNIYFDITQKISSYGFNEAANCIKKGIMLRFSKYKHDKFLYYLLAASYLNPFLDLEAIKIPEEDLPQDLKRLDEMTKEHMAERVFTYCNKSIAEELLD